ncbi:MAG: gliding motility-associated ABC transporter ATP-binding subunit GldA [Cytophagaceae bacterium]|jgi:ABC-2 type transport system ATP-binding protein|nr:gliding motility-associated ABC transporter ATP-binding subunit GldA [Cytophagaceae bacterium]
MSIEVSHLVKQYGKQQAVSDISFIAPKGIITGFLGPNGAGKSTTMKIATGYIPPTSGTVFVNGTDVAQYPLEVKRQVGYLPEHNPLYVDMFVFEYLQFIGHLYQWKGEVLTKRIAEMIEVCGLTLEQNKKIGALSKGYRQRVGLAQALLPNPSVLILDEPTTGLDPNQIVEIRQLIASIAENKTVILSTHIMQEVQALCQQVVIINRGTIVANDTVSALKQGKLNNRILRIQLVSEVSSDVWLQLPFVSQVQSFAFAVYELTIQADTDVRSEVFQFCAQHQWTILEMKEEERSLETIFRELTQQGIR